LWQHKTGRKLEGAGSFSPPSATLAILCSTANFIFLADFLEDRARCEKAGIVFHRRFSDEV